MLRFPLDAPVPSNLEKYLQVRLIGAPIDVIYVCACV